MFDGFDLKISQLEKRMTLYYDTDFLSDKDDTKENFEIKFSLRDVLIEANKELKNGKLEQVEFDTIFEKAINFFSKNTGCVEDIEILKKIFTDLLKLKIVDRVFVDDFLNASISQRWN